MRKLNPFQMPQLNSDNNEPQSVPVPSTSETIPNADETSIDKSEVEQGLQISNNNNDEVMVSYPSNPDLFNIVLNEQQQSVDLDRPRQYGRRSNPVRISSFAIESSDNGAAVRLKNKITAIRSHGEFNIIVLAYHCTSSDRAKTSKRTCAGRAIA